MFIVVFMVFIDSTTTKLYLQVWTVWRYVNNFYLLEASRVIFYGPLAPHYTLSD